MVYRYACSSHLFVRFEGILALEYVIYEHPEDRYFGQNPTLSKITSYVSLNIASIMKKVEWIFVDFPSHFDMYSKILITMIGMRSCPFKCRAAPFLRQPILPGLIVTMGSTPFESPFTIHTQNGGPYRSLRCMIPHLAVNIYPLVGRYLLVSEKNLSSISFGSHVSLVPLALWCRVCTEALTCTHEIILGFINNDIYPKPAGKFELFIWLCYLWFFKVDDTEVGSGDGLFSVTTASIILNSQR